MRFIDDIDYKGVKFDPDIVLNDKVGCQTNPVHMAMRLERTSHNTKSIGDDAPSPIRHR